MIAPLWWMWDGGVVVVVPVTPTKGRVTASDSGAYTVASSLAVACQAMASDASEDQYRIRSSVTSVCRATASDAAGHDIIP